MSDLTKLQNLQNFGAGKNKPLPPASFYHSPAQQDTNVLNQLKEKAPAWLSQDNIEDVKRYILTMLGHPTVKVELTDEMLAQCVQLSYNVCIPYIGRDLYAYTMATGLRSEYDMPTDAFCLREIYYKPAYLGSMGNVNQALFSDFYLLATDLAVDIYESPVTFWAYLASREMLEKTYGVWGSWEKIDKRRFRVYPTPVRDHIIGIQYKSMHMDLDEDKYNVFKEMALAYAKEMLGRIRSKYSSIPGSNNNQLTLDGAALLSEAREDKKDLFEKLKGLEPLLFRVF